MAFLSYLLEFFSADFNVSPSQYDYCLFTKHQRLWSMFPRNIVFKVGGFRLQIKNLGGPFYISIACTIGLSCPIIFFERGYLSISRTGLEKEFHKSLCGAQKSAFPTFTFDTFSFIRFFIIHHYPPFLILLDK